MVIKLKLLGHLREYLPGGGMIVDMKVAAGATVGEVFDEVGMPRDKPRIILVNQQRAHLDVVLEEGDTVVGLSAVGGG